MQQLSRAEIEAAFGEMGEYILRARKTAEIAVYGGAAILLQFEAQFRTADVNATVENGDHGAVLAAVQDVAARHGWLRSWFSEAVQNYIGSKVGSRFYASYPSEQRPGLRVYVATPDYLLAMKLRALRVGTRDEADARRLALATGITGFDALAALVTDYFPKEPPDPRRLAIIRQFAKGLGDAPPSDQSA